MKKLLVVGLMIVAGSVFSDEIPVYEYKDFVKECGPEVQKYCKGLEGNKLYKCFAKEQDNLSKTCRLKLTELKVLVRKNM